MKNCQIYRSLEEEFLRIKVLYQNFVTNLNQSSWSSTDIFIHQQNKFIEVYTV
jgi:hypothetical protein